MLYAEENGSGINTDEVKMDGIDVNDDGYTFPTTETSNRANDGLTVTQTYYYMSEPSSYFDNSKVYDMIFATEKLFWLASRCVKCYYSTSDTFAKAYFCLSNIKKSNLEASTLYHSDGVISYTSKINCLRPVVSLGADIQITPVENADGSSESNMHQINKQKSGI